MKKTELINLSKKFETIQYNDIVNIIDYIQKNSDLDFVKLKNENQQVVLHDDNYYYKIYEYDNSQGDSNFQYLIKFFLTEIYRKYGFNCQIRFIEQNNKTFIFEKKEKITVCSEKIMSKQNLLENWSIILQELMEKLQLDNVLKQIKEQKNFFTQVSKLILYRKSIFKFEDYGIKNQQIFLFDDDNFILIPVNDKGYICKNMSLPLDLPIEYSLIDQKNKCFFGPEIKKNISKNDEKTYYFTIRNVKNKITSQRVIFVNEKEKKMENEIELIYNNINYFTNNYLKNMEELYLNNYKKHSFQVELWEECDNYCQFCYLAQENLKTKNERKIIALNDLKNKLDNFNFDTYNNISLIGGEFFQGQLTTEEIKAKFFDCLLQIGDFYKQKKIGSCWLTVTLTKGEQKELYELLDLFQQKETFKPIKDFGNSGLWLCTSWDAKGRFHTEEYKKNWEYHMKNIHKKYPWIKFNTTIILTEPMIDLILNEKFNLDNFKKEFNTTLFFKQPGLGNRFEVNKYGLEPDKEYPLEQQLSIIQKAKKEANDFYGWNFFPTRQKFIDCLIKIKQDFPTEFVKLFNINYRADELIRNFNEQTEQLKMQRNKNSKKEEKGDTKNFIHSCGHILYYVPYIDSDICCLCDKKIIEDMI